MAAHGAAGLGAKVALIERDLLGGDCFNVGCVPSNALIRTSRLYAEMRKAEQYGAAVPTDIRVDFSAVMERMRRIRTRIDWARSLTLSIPIQRKLRRSGRRPLRTIERA